MIEWRDEGVVLAVRGHGENDAIVSLLTYEHGRHVGLVRGGRGRRTAPLLQQGNRLQCVWKARLADHLGNFTLEAQRLYVATMLDDPQRLAAVASATSLVEVSLAERDPHPQLYAVVVALLGRIAAELGWPADYVRFELMLLELLGYRLDLEACAVTGVTEDLVYVSPRTGRAVSRAGAIGYEAKLLTLPPFLRGEGLASPRDLADGLRLAGHFLRRHILDPADKAMPVARDRLVALLQPAEDPEPA